MKASLQLKMGQQLTMTPQLQQAIRLLQLSSLELQQEIQQALDSNPLLELDEEQSDGEPISNEDRTTSDSDSYSESDSDNEYSSNTDVDPQQDSAAVDTSDALTQDSMPDELPMDTTWDEVYTVSSNSSSGGMRDDDMPFQGETTEGLYEHLEWQKNLTPFSDNDLAIATAIIDAVDERGYLTQNCEDILEAMGDPEIEIDEVEAVLKRVQHFDPIGVAARDLSECLLIQLAQYAETTPHIDNARLLIKDYLDLIAGRDFRQLMRKTKLKEDDLRDAITLIQTLNPRPGLAVTRSKDEYVIPDVSVTKKKGRWVVELNPDYMPKINVNQHYASMARSQKNQADGQFIRSHLQEAKWFIKSIESRNETLLKVSNCIVKFQQGFFEYGDEAMKPMVLNDIAEAVEMHESTISRVTTQKYMHTPRGIFELKYFFSSHVGTDDGGECSSTAIRAFIKKLVAAENQQKPLSDSKMAQLLAEQGIKVARRTIAKYREAMMIPPSNQRKSL
ncbi:RNA polymerase factor sigma-54 [Shewanella sp. Choline-02u-19]|jgi:RNA polymerase sigma-54 factor|uniref:RNA polymerase factor sigma-54 n=1 Tax=unclassified Shewanella TaxID=196818 RepID=UPI000C32EBFB|nr:MULTISPECIES: RNA polymerase factor sigma-54 [unclassified Shewanella]PKG56295.1 RNA polymerase factor sigma-54 [Shewanella sp. GutDb-MelDb]PKG74494.1 RNA polymerase factor sigma-54 [Shewanella sp. GutCb]PKH55523.1 RNA polymerase factor sigma-54 [Shewanella sp. Bg11-22]PKI28869.1 RNA polymerase factor sigma-54 [Shewanella sp. Choline-02u-19]